MFVHLRSGKFNLKYVYIHRMEEALIEMKKRNDELVRENKDAIDSPTSPKFFTSNDQVMHLKEELKRREAAHTERIVEMVRLQPQASLSI